MLKSAESATTGLAPGPYRSPPQWAALSGSVARPECVTKLVPQLSKLQCVLKSFLRSYDVYPP